MIWEINSSFCDKLSSEVVSRAETKSESIPNVSREWWFFPFFSDILTKQSIGRIFFLGVFFPHRTFCLLHYQIIPWYILYLWHLFTSIQLILCDTRLFISHDLFLTAFLELCLANLSALTFSPLGSVTTYFFSWLAF